MNEFNKILEEAVGLAKSKDLKGRREGILALKWLYNQGRRLIRLNKEFGVDPTEIERTRQDIKKLIGRI